MAASRTRQWRRRHRAVSVGLLATLGALAASSLVSLGAGAAFPAASQSWKIAPGPR